VTPPADPVAPEPAAADPAATAAAEPVAETAPAAPEPAAEAIAPAIDPPEDASSSTVQPLAASAITTETEAEPTSKEEQDVDEQISNFVAGATTDASTPADPTAASETPAESTAAAQPEAPAAETDNSASNDKLVSDAVQSLLKETEDKDVPTPPPLPPSEAAKVQIKAASSATDGPSPDAGADTDAVDKPASDNNVTIAHKKVIAPPTQDAAKPDIQTLFELEQAKEAATTINNAPPQAVIADEKGKATEPLKTPPPAPEAGDPNSIAL
jgi:2-oxoglutarate dehydrogenase E2 component (dihydrolipoamide succinyltransferase)